MPTDNHFCSLQLEFPSRKISWALIGMMKGPFVAETRWMDEHTWASMSVKTENSIIIKNNSYLVGAFIFRLIQVSPRRRTVLFANCSDQFVEWIEMSSADNRLIKSNDLYLVGDVTGIRIAYLIIPFPICPVCRLICTHSNATWLCLGFK